MMNLVLNVEVDQRYYQGIEASRKIFSVLQGDRVPRTERDTAKSPWDSSHQVGNHEDIVPVMVVGGRYIGPSAASQSSEQAHASDELWKS
jgi:hypothetical protein